MQWKEALFIKNKEGKINNEIYEALLKFPEIRNQVFVPDYKKYGYEVLEPVYHEFGTGSSITSVLRAYILSVKTNHVIALSYIFMNNSHELGIISDNILLADAVKGWGITICISLLAENRGIPIDKKYNIPEIYEGNAVEKLEECIKQIKLNYDTIAPDIISGENWDSDAWNVGDNF